MKTAHYLQEKNVIRLCFPLDRVLLKELNKISYLEQTKDAWETDVSRENVLLLKKLGFTFSKSLQNWESENIKTQNKSPATHS